jgi:hypothetical protein
MNTNLHSRSFFKSACLVAAVSATLYANAAHAAGDITMRNTAHQLIHPYFKSNCWADGFPATEWRFFGGIFARSQFTWDGFQALLAPNCKKPVIKATFALAGEPAPVGKVKDRTKTIRFDANENYVITLADRVFVVDDSDDD